MDERTKAIYSDYLQLDKVLAAQTLLSAENGQPVHEELLFIVMHQVYELWFKQIIADLDQIFQIFESPAEQQDMQHMLLCLQRMNKIFHVLLKQFEVIETMTPLQFLNFRGHLGTMSGFQSYQFRLVETKFGLQRDERLLYAKCPYDIDLKEPQKEILHAAEKHPSLFAYVKKWLERLPFLKTQEFDFIKVYQTAFETMMKSEKKHIKEDPKLIDEERKVVDKSLIALRDGFEVIFNENHYNDLLKTGERRLSYKSFLAVLFIRLYRHYPLLHLPDLLLTEILEVNSLFALWRFRHSQMVQKMIGYKKGTGGSSGVHYLQETVEKYNVFGDLSLIPMLLLPENYLPKLPKGLIPSVNFFFSSDL